MVGPTAHIANALAVAMTIVFFIVIFIAGAISLPSHLAQCTALLGHCPEGLGMLGMLGRRVSAASAATTPGLLARQGSAEPGSHDLLTCR